MQLTHNLALAALLSLVTGSRLPRTPIGSRNNVNSMMNMPRQEDGTKMVFAHYMLGLTSGQTAEQWTKDISDAQTAGVDGFALNMGPEDEWSVEQLGLAYDAASSSGFSLFISFDMNTLYLDVWTPEMVAGLVNDYSNYTAQYRVDGVPLVSTFEGPDWADNWQAVRDQTGGIYLVPDWASIGPDGVGAHVDKIEGAFSWNAWPGAGETTKTTDEDMAYQEVLYGAGKAYMMGVAPYFYVNLAEWSKNWYSSSDSLWFDRWKQVLELQPEFIELITWNDFSESSYLNAPVDSQIVAGAEVYVDGFDHTAFSYVMPYFISAYKSGDPNVAIPNGEGAMAWYRTTSDTACSDGGTTWGDGGGSSAADGTEDVISIIALSESGSAPAVSVTVGGATASVEQVDSVGKAYFFQASFSGMTGAVSVDVAGKSATGPEISGSCPSSGYVSFSLPLLRPRSTGSRSAHS